MHSVGDLRKNEFGETYTRTTSTDLRIRNALLTFFKLFTRFLSKNIFCSRLASFKNL